MRCGLYRLNSTVLSCRLNALNCISSRRFAGKLFHTRGPATEKLLSPKVLWVRGRKHVSSVAERRFWRPRSTASWMSAARFLVVIVLQEPELDDESTSDSSDAGDMEEPTVNGSDLDSDDDEDDKDADAAAAAPSASQSDCSSSDDDDDDDVGGGAVVDVVTESDDEETGELLEKKLLEDTASRPTQVGQPYITFLNKLIG